ncbi:ACT domain-containing protein [Limisalsivibrio acetivorans]|uniref:ACT domain-containing protein n=1 Tax=Limisalsivibrio acetivorans TaxID=1304888 RepID=UPI0003B68682|nr:ACT domain-containing protein [Limisalsivibrio acetivorans]
MKIGQISVFIENESGRLFEVTDLLGKNNINIRALSLADTSDFGILRLIVNDPDRAYTLLKENDFTVGRTEVLAIEVPDDPGGLAGVLGVLSENSLNVEYMYALVETSSDCAVMIFRFDETDKAIEVLKGAGYTLMEGKKIYEI